MVILLDSGSGRSVGAFRDSLLAASTMGVNLSRVDLHISRTGDGELLLTSRQDGMIRMLVPDASASATAPTR